MVTEITRVKLSKLPVKIEISDFFFAVNNDIQKLSFWKKLISERGFLGKKLLKL